MKSYIQLLGMVGFSMAITGCNTSPTRAEISKDEATAQQIRSEAEAAQAKKKQVMLEKEVNALPAWVLSAPRNDADGVYGVGIGSDTDLLNAIRKAKLQGLYEVAKSMSTELSGEETMTGSGSGEYRYITNLLVNKADVSGAEVIQQEVKPVNGIFKTYVLMKLQFSTFKRVFMSQQNSSAKSELEESYNRLMKRISTPVQTAANAIPSQTSGSNIGKETRAIPLPTPIDIIE